MNTRLSESEKEIMNLIISTGRPMTFREILDKFNATGKDWKKQTLNTFLLRMREKGKLTIQKQTEKNVYIAHITNLDTLPKAEDAQSTAEIMEAGMNFCNYFCPAKRQEECKEGCKANMEEWLLQEPTKKA